MSIHEHLGHDEKNPYCNISGLFSEKFVNHILETSENPFIRQHWDVWQEDAYEKTYQRIRDLWVDKKDQLPLMKEAELEDEFVREVLKILGWEYRVQPSIERYGKLSIPDYALFTSKAAKEKSIAMDDLKLFASASVIAEAKAWSVDLDGGKTKSASPAFQIYNYTAVTKVRWGILTNGLNWRLYCADSNGGHHSFFEINLESLLSTKSRDKFRYFYCFFRREAFEISPSLRQSFVDVAFSDAETYGVEVEESLKKRAFEIVEKISQGFLYGKGAVSEEELQITYDLSLQLLFRLIFTLNCEASGVLDTSLSQSYFAYSLRNLALKIRDENPKDWGNQSFSYSHVIKLMKLVSKGDERLGVTKLSDELLDPDATKYFANNEIPDFLFNEILSQLAFKREGKTNWFIDYSTLGVDHLGSIYEGLLEYELTYKGGKVVISADAVQREKSGSYYTQEPVVKMMTDSALKLATNKSKDAKALLEIKVLDPAMGSGHFLAGATRWLEAAIQTRLNEGDHSLDEYADEISTAVLRNCIFGIDINKTAVELAKYSLWIATAKRGKALASLKNKFVCFNSLVDKKSYVTKLGNQKFDCVLANPPYVAQKDSEEVESSGESEGQSDLYLEFFKSTMLGDIPLKASGVFAFIIPDPFLVRGNAKSTRAVLLDENRLVSVVHATGLFPKVGVSNVILTGTRDLPNAEDEISFVRLDQKQQRDELFKTARIPEDCRTWTHKLHNFRQSEGRELTYLIEAADRKRFAKMSSGTTTITPHFKDRRGEEISKAKVNAAKSPNGIPIAIGGESVGPFEFRAESIVKVKPELIKKDIAAYSPIKIMLQKSSPKFVAVVDDGKLHKAGVVCTQAIYTLRKASATFWMDEWALCAILNSKLANDWLFKRVTGYKLLQPHFEQNDLKSFPLPSMPSFSILQFHKVRKSFDAKLSSKQSFSITAESTDEDVWAAISAVSEFVHSAKAKARRDEKREKDLTEFLNSLVELSFGFQKAVKLAA